MTILELSQDLLHDLNKDDKVRLQMMNTQMYLFDMWHKVLIGEESNWGFFVELNAGWLEMEFNHRYGNQPSEKDYWEWMFLNAECIKISAEDYDCLAKQLNFYEDQ